MKNDKKNNTKKITGPLTAVTAGIAAAGGALYVLRRFYEDVFTASGRGGAHPDRTYQVSLQNEHRDEILKMIAALDQRPHENLSILSSDGLKLTGRLYLSQAEPDPAIVNAAADGQTPAGSDRSAADSPRPCIIGCHGYKSAALRDFYGVAPRLLDKGLNVLLIDERGQGPSEGDAMTFGVREAEDIVLWADEMVERFGKETPLALFGISMGASAVLLASDPVRGLPPQVRAVIADCPFSSAEAIMREVIRGNGQSEELTYRLTEASARLYARLDLNRADVRRAVSRTGLPVLLIHGEEDKYVPCHMSRTLKEANPECVELHTFPGAGHARSYLTDPERYDGIVSAYLERVGLL